MDDGVAWTLFPLSLTTMEAPLHFCGADHLCIT